MTNEKKLYLSIRVVSAVSKLAAIKAIEHEEFIDDHELSDAIIPLDEFKEDGPLF